jgi:hypothetical protein
MIPEIAFIATKAPLFASCAIIAALGVADANVAQGTPEDYTLKGLLTIALVFTVRPLLKQQADHKAELAARDVAAHAERDKREAATLAAMNAYTQELKSLTAPVMEQATYFKSVVAKLVERGLDDA